VQAHRRDSIVATPPEPWIDLPAMHRLRHFLHDPRRAAVICALVLAAHVGLLAHAVGHLPEAEVAHTACALCHAAQQLDHALVPAADLPPCTAGDFVPAPAVVTAALRLRLTPSGARAPPFRLPA
jgi:hypothetical protein